MASAENLRPPWAPGESGNPAGGSRKRTVRTLVKQWLRDVNAAPVPEDLLETIPPELRENASEVLIGQVLAHKLVRAALQGDQKALELILSTEPKELKVDLPLNGAAKIETEPARLQEVSEILSETETLH